MGRAVAGRTSACAGGPGAHGQTPRINFGRTLRRTGSRRAGTFSTISSAAGHAIPQLRSTDARVGDTSRRGNHAGVFLRADLKTWPCASGREKTKCIEFKKSFRRVRGADAITTNWKTLCVEGSSETARDDVGRIFETGKGRLPECVRAGRSNFHPPDRVGFMKNPFLTNIAVAGDGHTPSQANPVLAKINSCPCQKAPVQSPRRWSCRVGLRRRRSWRAPTSYPGCHRKP
jgi:hypothetical protein